MVLVHRYGHFNSILVAYWFVSLLMIMHAHDSTLIRLISVMTTIGYGNQAPTTTAGRTMVYTLGFASILAFAANLAMAGYITSAIADDFAKRIHLNLLTRPWISSLVWGSIYYAWLLILASVTAKWKHNILGEENFSFRDGYWFSYISSTTVGLGDIFLEPEVLRLPDVFLFPVLLLSGFTILSAFLGKLFDAITVMLGVGKKKSIVNTLLRYLVQVDTDRPFITALERRNSGEAGVSGSNVCEPDNESTRESRFHDAQEEFEDTQSVEDIP